MMKKPSLQRFVGITQILSSLAVIISIFLLITEYRRSGVLNEKEVENLVYSRIMELDRLLIENAEFAELLNKAYTTPDSLNETEKMRYLAYEHIFFDSWETLYVGFQDGLVEKNTWIDWNLWFSREAARKPDLAIRGNENNYSPDFLQFIRKQIKTK
jgi:hypothetical protein